MAIHSDGSYGVPKGLIFSFPVTLKVHLSYFREMENMKSFKV
jgi:hypothetical protein